MLRTYRHVDYRVQDGVFCVRIKDHRLQESDLEELSAELGRLIDEDGCQLLVLSLGPCDFECLYSVFLAKLINLQRRLEGVGGKMAVAEASPNTVDVFRATGLEKHFNFYPDQLTALHALLV